MSKDKRKRSAHPSGEQPLVEVAPLPAPVMVESWAGPVRVEWDVTAPLTPFGQLPFFIQFLKVSGLFDAYVADCPLTYTSPNAPSKRDVLGTVLLSVLAGHKRYAHITALRADNVLCELIGMSRVLSEDAVRRALHAIAESEGVLWLQGHLDYCTAPLFGEPWIMDVDTTIKPLYGKQEGAVVGYNPKKPGRPSHVYHTYMLANLRLVLDVEVMAGNQHAFNHAAVGLWALLDRIGRDRWPQFLRGDAGVASDALMRECEQRRLPYLFKLRVTNNVKKALERAMRDGIWLSAGSGWQGQEDQLKLVGWEKPRRVVLLRRRLKEPIGIHEANAQGQLQLSFAEVEGNRELWEYSALVTSLDDEILTLGQLYRDRADCENAFDELKNQWGWGGFTTHDLARCQLAARNVALIYNWWSLFVRLAESGQHLEAITSRPLLLASIGALVRHARQTTLRVASSHGRAGWAAAALAQIAQFLGTLTNAAEQLTPLERWYRILSRALRHFLKGRQLRAPPRLAKAAV
jgi:Transposase DDE domain group 1